MTKFLSILAIFKNETMNLEEWISHYLWQGVEHFYLIDNGSTDDPSRILSRYAHCVTLYSRAERHAQKQHYNEIYKEIRATTTWLIVADLDEFWYGAQTGSTLRSALQKTHDKVDVVYAPWRMFGTSGHVDHPKSLRRDLIHCWPEPAPTQKYILRTRSILPGDLEIHYVRSQRKVSITDTTGQVFALNHYPLQSVEFFTKVKMTRGSACHARHDDVRTQEYFNSYNNKAVVINTALSDMLKSRA